MTRTRKVKFPVRREEGLETQGNKYLRFWNHHNPTLIRNKRRNLYRLQSQFRRKIVPLNKLLSSDLVP